MSSLPVIPVVLFAHARPAHLVRVLASLQENNVPLIHAFSDGGRGPADIATVAATRAILQAVDWTEIKLVERAKNLGLGRNVLAGVTEVAARYDSFIVWEDDLVAVPGTYAWLCAALRNYAADPRVMSVTAWTHPRVAPAPEDGAYFDARAECWVWGGYRRSWRGMEETARKKMAAVVARGLAADAYGADLPRMARGEMRKNIWAVRWLYHHFQHGGLCLRPPWSMVEHIGFDVAATNAGSAQEWANPSLKAAPPLPKVWPEPTEHPAVRRLWSLAYPPESTVKRMAGKVNRAAHRGGVAARALAKSLLPAMLRQKMRTTFGWQWFRGDYATWAEASAASTGYDDAVILARVLAATWTVQSGQAAFERDGVVFEKEEADAPLLEALDLIRAAQGRLWVLDFGGALGSIYWRHRTHLPTGTALVWDVVEQAGFVAAGREHLGDTPLLFFPTVGEAEAKRPHDVLLCSTTLQYLEAPGEVIAGWRAGRWPYLLLNNLPLHESGPDRLRVQQVPPDIYPASYPVWFFNRAKLLQHFLPDYELLREFASEAVWPVDRRRYPSRGLLFKRKDLP
jgi:putative methyltransferase (TIGR04325 family)